MGNEILAFGDKLKALRKKKGYTQEYAAAQIGCTPKTYRSWEHSESANLRSDYLEALVKVFDVDMDYLTGRIEEGTHNKQFICDYLGLSGEAVDLLHHLKEHGNAEEQQTINFINRVLSDPGKAPGSGLLDVTLFSWLEQYVTLGSVNLYDLYPDERKRVNIPAFELTSGITERVFPEELYQQFLLNRIRDTLEAYRKDEQGGKKK